MHTTLEGLEERNLIMTSEAEKLTQYWRKRLATECPEQSASNHESIIRWFLGNDEKRLDSLKPQELDIAKQAMEYRWRILSQRYLGVGRERAYRNLITRLGSLATLRNKIQTWIALSRDRQQKVLDVLQEVLQELLQSDNYMQQQMAFISQFTTDTRLRDGLLFASMEEYCLRPVRNQPLLVYRFINYLRRSQRGGLTQVPSKDMIRLVSEEILGEDSDSSINLVDSQVVADYESAQAIEEQTLLRQMVKQQFAEYLQENLGQEAVEWLNLYLQGKTQDAIAKKFNKPIREIYRLREKISYHAVRVFAIKNKSELVEGWLEISLEEHNLGLTQTQLELLDQKITPKQRHILRLLKTGKTLAEIAEQLKLKNHQIMGEWSKIYLAAQSLRIQES
ncbi:MAG: HetZ-related protein 2 [Calothrix sp. MO_192.B10]|nr:HetZ-related protein 2 [Calothrix sp. MO_192.B10]